MPLQIICVGQKDPKWCETAFVEYEKRLKKYCKFNLINLPLSPWHKKNNPSQAIQDEHQKITSHLMPQDFVIALDETGKQFSSQRLAQNIERWQQNAKRLVFIIGGPLGLHDSLKQKANCIWSLSELTFPHHMVRVLLIEQLYRAYSIIANHPYHKV